MKKIILLVLLLASVFSIASAQRIMKSNGVNYRVIVECNGHKPGLAFVAPDSVYGYRNLGKEVNIDDRILGVMETYGGGEVYDVIGILPNAFKNCKTIEKVIISSRICRIESFAFKGCSNLAEVTILHNKATIAVKAFDGCKKIKKIFVPKGTADYYKEQLPKNLKSKVVED